MIRQQRPAAVQPVIIMHGGPEKKKKNLLHKAFTVCSQRVVHRAR
jgi:hypothetical protein